MHNPLQTSPVGRHFRKHFFYSKAINDFLCVTFIDTITQHLHNTARNENKTQKFINLTDDEA